MMPFSRKNNEIHLIIQYARAASAVLIVCFHIGEQYNLRLSLFGIGTDFFFVISGYIIWLRSIGNSDGPVAFLVQRALRIIPLYWIASITTAIVSDMKPQFFYEHTSSVMDLGRSLLFIPDLGGNVIRSYMVQGLTLSYIVSFYAVFSLGLIFKENTRYWYILLVLAMFASVHFILPYGYTWVFTSPIILEFAAGIIIARILTSGRRIKSRTALVMSIFGMAAFLCFEFLMPDLDRLLRRGIPAALILAGFVFAERERKPPNLAIPNFLGNASYSIYLWHVLAGICVTALLLRLGVPASVQPWIVIGGSIGLSLCAYALVEIPLGRTIASWRKRKAMKPSSDSSENPARYSFSDTRPSFTRPVSL